MLLEYTIAQLDIGAVSEDRAQEMGHLGYLQWLGALRRDASFVEEANRASKLASPYIESSPAIAVFCDLLAKSVAEPLTPIDLKLPPRSRRGGAKSRRRTLSKP